jgi:pimeloyl-ACP methyl ester carboxylesterase
MNVFKTETAKSRVINTYNQLLDMWNVEKIEKEITTTYGITHVILCGNESNPPLVLFHGVGDNSALMWIYNAAALSRYFRLYAIDTIGGPGKSCPNKNYNKNFDIKMWIDEILTWLKLDKVYIAGVSHGAYMAQYYGLYRPERVIKIACLACTVPAKNPDKKSNLIKTMMKIFLPEVLFPTKKNTVKLVCKLCGKNSAIFTENAIIMEHYQYLLKGFNNMAMIYHKIVSFDEEQIKVIREKALYLIGENDPFAKLGGKDVLLNNRMKVKFFPEVGHGINHEISNTINQILIEYYLK